MSAVPKFVVPPTLNNSEFRPLSRAFCKVSVALTGKEMILSPQRAPPTSLDFSRKSVVSTAVEKILSVPSPCIDSFDVSPPFLLLLAILTPPQWLDSRSSVELTPPPSLEVEKYFSGNSDTWKLLNNLIKKNCEKTITKKLILRFLMSMIMRVLLPN